MLNRKLIVLDDDEVACEIVSASAAKAGFEPVAFSSADALRGSPDLDDCDLLVLDLNLSDTDGVEVLHYLGQRRFEPPILLISVE